METIGVPCGDAGEMNMKVWAGGAPDAPAILLIQEIFGVGAYIEAVAERLVAAGYAVGAPDVFWRFAPGWEAGHDPDGLAASLDMVGKLDPGLAVADCVAALDVLAQRSGAKPGVIGFCLGGTLGWGVAVAADPAVVVSYYGSGVADMLGDIDKVACPVLFHFGNSDAFIPGESVEAINAAIDGRPGFVLNVENAGHAFDNHEAEMFWNESAAQAAWAKTMAFFGEHLPVG